MSKCATCYPDPTTKHWKALPGERYVRPLGTSQSNWVCRQCRKKATNRHWTCTPSEEIYGLEQGEFEDAQPEAEGEQGQYETALCVEIMKLYCFDVPQREIAKRTETSLSYVIAVVGYWKTHRGYFVSEVRRILTADSAGNA